MTRWFHNLSLSLKLVGMNVGISTLVLGLALTVLLATDAATFHRTLTSNLTSLAQIIANSNTATLVFYDVQAAQENLEALRDNAEIASVSILTTDGGVFAEYINPQVSDELREQLLNMPPSLPGSEAGGAIETSLTRDIGTRLLRVEQPIVLDGETVGHVAIYGDKTQLYDRMGWYASIVVSVMVVFAVVAMVLSLAFQRIITTPIRSLVGNMKAVSDSGDYSIRAEEGNKDEVGALIAGFNNMLDYIQGQNAELASHGARLEEEVVARTADLTTAKDELEQTVEELQEAKDVAEAASKAKSDFLAKMSHEIRTPMNGVLGMLELLAGSALAKRQRQFATTARRSGEHLLRIINDILDVSKIESGKLEIAKDEFELREAIEHTVELFGEPACKKSLKLMCWMEPDVPPYAVGDEGRLRQILTNLLGNAIKFTEEGEVVVRVKRLEADQLTLRFEVEDTGIGVAPDRQANLFDAFRQADDSVTRLYGGTGLGLAIAKQLVEAMGGTIGMYSEQKSGTMFWFTVRLEEADRGEEIPMEEHSLPASVRALVVDDNPTHLEILRRWLSNWQVECDAISDPYEALRRVDRSASVENRPYDVLIAAMEMRGMRGPDLARRLQTGLLTPAPPILLTGDGMSGDRQACAEAEFVAECLSRPVRESGLRAALWRTLCAQPQDGRSSVPAETMTRVSAVSGPALGIRVLLAEDNEANVEVACAMLQEMGCLVDVANDGQEVLAWLEQESFDVILMDCQMPRLDGYEATRKIRRLEARSGQSEIPIIALTAHAVSGDREQCLAAGMNDYLAKPITMASLRAGLERWCTGTSTVPGNGDAGASSPRAAALPEHPPSDTEFDSAQLDQLRSLRRPGRPDAVARVIDAYLGSCPELLERVHAAMAEGDDEELGDAAHALKSSSLNVGAVGLASLCSELEKQARSREGVNAGHLVPRIECAFSEVHETLNEIRMEPS